MESDLGSEERDFPADSGSEAGASISYTVVEPEFDLDALFAEMEEVDLNRETLLLPIESVTLQKFKQFKEVQVDMSPGITLMAGGNNSGKSSVLQALAVWEFCRLATLMEKGPEGLTRERVGFQGFGLGDDEFSPINIPTLKHMWTNLKPQQKEVGQDGYTLKIGCQWITGLGRKHLTFGLSLANDRLFVRIEASNLSALDRTPRMAYLPPFAGITSREGRINGAVRRRRIGEGLAGAVLRNLLLDMYQANVRKRAELLTAAALKGSVRKPRIKSRDLEELRRSDPWEILQQSLREVFGAELTVGEFREEYHSYIQVFVTKGTVSGHILTAYPNFTKRDLMVEGSGFLQWLSVFALATNEDVDVLLLDEPDAHLHPKLQKELVRRLGLIVAGSQKQIFIATHSSEILRSAAAERVMEFRPGRSPRYLSGDFQKVGMLEGIGSDYAPHIDRIRQTKKVFFHEGTSDLSVLKTIADTLGTPLSSEWVPWRTTHGQRERKMLWQALTEDVPGIEAISLRDRDEGEVATVGPNLEDKDSTSVAGFRALKWRRRHIENYLLLPSAIAGSTGLSEDQVIRSLQEDQGIFINGEFTRSNAASTYLEARGKAVLTAFKTDAVSVAKHIDARFVCDDLKTVIAALRN
ncbi:AAA family ATPase [Arthrobacter sp. SAFR-044]|uniref:ATP-binding protein n=1 Tax=Arthrobacter sp. SAFR-044 TaxID=3387278 RepID=UPI003F7B6A9F